MAQEKNRGKFLKDLRMGTVYQANPFTKKGPDMDCKYFNPEVNYDRTLERLKASLLKRWQNDEPSPHTNLQNFEEFNVLGSGSFGRVVMVKHKESNKQYACKVMVKEHIIKTKSLKHVFAEKRVLQSVCFPFLIGLEFSTKDNDCIYMGLPLCLGGDLYHLLRKLTKMPEKNCIFYAGQIFLGLEYLHTCGIAYRDLKPENIMLDHLNGYIKIVDFGFAKRIKDRTYTFCGTPEYLAPEIIQSMPYGMGVDWWAFGCLIYELVDGRTPFIAENNTEIALYTRICDGNYRMPLVFSLAFQDLIKRLLQTKSTKRIGCMLEGAKGIKNHEWFRGVNWFGLLNMQVTAPYIPGRKSSISQEQKNKMKPIPKSKVDRYSDEFAFF